MRHFSCCYCDGNIFNAVALSVFHKVKKDYGPFDLYECVGCGSLVTFPLPDRKKLNELYQSFDGGIDPRLRHLRKGTPLTAWYLQTIDAAIKHKKELFSKDSFTWLEAGAGDGELAELMAKRYPNSKGITVDFNPAPTHLKAYQNIEWRTCDLNDPAWQEMLSEKKFDVIFSLAVLEHVIAPDRFLKNLANLLAHGGMLYLVSPDYGSFAAKLLKKKWPFFLPGEHLHIATMRGLSKWFQKTQQESGNAFKAKVHKTFIPYPLRYVLQFMRLNGLAKLFSGKKTVKLKAGLLELIITRRK